MDEERILNGLYVTYDIGCFIDDVTIHDMYMIRGEKISSLSYIRTVGKRI